MKRSKAALQSLGVDLLYLIASPLILLAYLVISRGFTRPKYRRGLSQKLGFVPVRDGDARSIWVHAVSVGEVQTCVPLVEALAERFPDDDISISVSTYTGFHVARKRFPNRTIHYAPLDLSFCVTRAYRRRRPDLVLLVELELWPNFLLVARRLGVPALVVNGRVTERSCRGYERAGFLGRWLFSLVDDYAVQNDEYAARFRRLGVPEERLAILGNLKHGRSAGVTPEEARSLRDRLGWSTDDGHVVLVGGSTHPGEESLLCRVLAELREKEPKLRLILVPRHVERLVAGESDNWGADRPIVRWSQWAVTEGDSRALGDQILLVDTVGELERVYALADLVVVGGSFIPHGGHNVLEPACLGKATCFGPHTANFRDEVRILLDADAARQLDDGSELSPCLGAWIDDPQERRSVGERASRAVAERRGAITEQAEWVRRIHLSIQETN
jgi:3-deoxy-D-manno-octulosonic-acid transferase